MSGAYQRAFDILLKDLSAPPDRRRYRRLPVELNGRMLDSAGRERDCRTRDLSAGGARITVAGDDPPAGGAVIWLDRLGRLPGDVVRMRPNDLGVQFNVGLAKRERIVEELTLIVNAERLEQTAPRRPAAALIDVTTAQIETGETILVRVLECSLQGATLTTAQTLPRIGSWVRVGMTDGCVARHFDGGFDLDFARRPAASA